jgi:hypothetical protein
MYPVKIIQKDLSVDENNTLSFELQRGTEKPSNHYEGKEE